jgi:hypothetical protein
MLDVGAGWWHQRSCCFCTAVMENVCLTLEISPESAEKSPDESADRFPGCTAECRLPADMMSVVIRFPKPVRTVFSWQTSKADQSLGWTGTSLLTC